MPFCPSCGVRVAAGAARCGLDGALLERLECPECAGEVGPRDRFCGHCRCDLRQKPVRARPLELLPAPLWRRLAAAAFDYLATLFILQGLLFQWQAGQQALVALAALPLVLTLLEASDRMSPGQQIFALYRLRPDGTRLRWADWPALWLQAISFGHWARERSRLFWVPR